VEWASGRGVTRDVSIGGIYFEATEVPAERLAEVIITVLIEGAFPDVAARFQCTGTVVRIEPEGEGKYGVAVRFSSIDFKGRDTRSGS
jgi:c-di-GMP-binding flagellar brake protein YcgR